MCLFSKQERLILSVIPRFIALQMINDISSDPQDVATVRGSFAAKFNPKNNRIYIQNYDNVR